jgi:non-heme Fe2+,alpha-ketoglutarate-dependent halogenase
MSQTLAFFPADETKCETLSSGQVATFNRQGYLSDLSVFEDKETLSNREYFDELLWRVLKSGRDSYSINSYQAKCAGIFDICMNVRIRRMVKDLIGPSFVCWGSHLLCKMPGDPKRIAWHQDAPHWPLAPSRTVTAWLAIDDTDQANGAMRIIPGSHRGGSLPFCPSLSDSSNLLHHRVDVGDSELQAVFLELAAGRISIHSDLLLHSSEPNRSVRRRCGLAIRYAATDVSAGGGWNANSILCMGQDPLNHWAHIDRPKGEDLSPWRHPWNAKFVLSDPQ